MRCNYSCLGFGFIISLVIASSGFARMQTETVAPLANQEQDSGGEVENGAESIPRPDFFDDTTDFSKAPEVAKVEGPSSSEIIASIDRGARFLLATQNPDGSFGSHVSKRIGEIYAPLPGSHHAFRAATTALSISALLETKADDPAARESIKAAQEWMFEKLPSVKRAQGDTIYNVWAHAYAIQALVRLKTMTDQTEEDLKKIDELMAGQIKMLENYESIDGGWGYYDFVAQGKKPTGSSISFVNATVLIAFKEAEETGVEIPEKIVKRAYAAIERQQKPDFTYLYGEYLKNMPMRGINQPGGSLGRSQACNLAMRLWGDEKITDNVLKCWLYRLYLRNGWLDMGRKRPIPHESWMQVAGYFYYYGHYYAGLTIDQLKPEDRDEYRNLLASIMIKHQEPNGCWWDYTLYSYHQQYGTAFALMTMQRCIPEDELKRIAEKKANQAAQPSANSEKEN
jgi:hypothetical protein